MELGEDEFAVEVAAEFRGELEFSGPAEPGLVTGPETACCQGPWSSANPATQVEMGALGTLTRDDR